MSQSKNFKVTVLLALYNGEKYIKEQLNSIVRQKYVDLNILIYDDFSSDDSLKIIRNIKRKFKYIKYIRAKKNSGNPSYSFYNLVSQINDNSDYYAFADQDDIWKDNRLYSSIKYMKINNKDGYSSDVLCFDENKKYTYLKKSHAQTKYDFLFETPGPGCSFILSKNLTYSLKNFILRNRNELNNFLYHDWFVYAFARKFKFPWVISNRINLFYRQHENNFVGSNSGIKAFILRLKRIIELRYIHEILYLNKLLNIKNFDNSFKFITYMIINFYKTRRKGIHKLFTLIILIYSFFMLIIYNEKK